ncbi:MAG: hypothetical protein ACQSGP_07410 [Frankia sp.]
MSLSGFELVKSSLAGGPNGVVFFDSFSASDVGVVRVDLGPPSDPTQNQGVVNRSPGNDGLFGEGDIDRFELRGGNDVTDAVPGEVVIP